MSITCVSNASQASSPSMLPPSSSHHQTTTTTTTTFPSEKEMDKSNVTADVSSGSSGSVTAGDSTTGLVPLVRHKSSQLHRRNSSMDDGTAQQLTAVVLQDMIEDSEFFQRTAYSSSSVPALPSFSPSDVQVGATLGHGQFGEVLELIQLRAMKEGCEQNIRLANQITEHNGKYAVKRLFRNVQTSLCDDAIADLGCEAMFLSRLSRHENIIRLHATVGLPGSSSFMLILDRLVCNLHEKMHDWRSERQRCRGKALGFWNRNKAGLDSLYSVQLQAATDIARALQYLHSYRILFRDIKPENIGVKTDGGMCLFDFGLAKELKRRDLVERPDGYQATGKTGSRRYMSPEVRDSLPYGFSADVYSFGILLWEIMHLQTPFWGYDSAKHYELVVRAKQRPPLPRGWSKSLKKLLCQCWAHSPLERSDIGSVYQSLQNQLREVGQ